MIKIQLLKSQKLALNGVDIKEYKEGDVVMASNILAEGLIKVNRAQKFDPVQAIKQAKTTNSGNTQKQDSGNTQKQDNAKKNK